MEIGNSIIKWMGCTVSVRCKNDVGTFQGQISSVDTSNQVLILRKTFKNGVPSNQVSIRADDIVELEILKSANEMKSESGASSTVSVKKAKRRSISDSIVTNKINSLQIEQYNDLSKRLGDNTGNDVIRTPKKKESARKKLNNKEKDEVCFGTPIDDFVDQDFDFEKNLKLFNKQAFYETISCNQKPDLLHQTDGSRRHPKKYYNHNENVLSASPAVYRQVIVPEPGDKEYVTDEGMIIPSITPEFRHELLCMAERLGLTIDRQCESMGRAATEISLQLLGGGHRLNPNNVHQWPCVVLLCGSFRQGQFTINAARQLTSHGVNTVVFMLESSNLSDSFTRELALYKLTGHKIITKVQDLPTAAVDLILIGLTCNEVSGSVSGEKYNNMVSWINHNRAPVLALDPPLNGNKNFETKFALVPFLPLPYSSSSGKLYLCNIGCPQQVFTKLGIKYKSPFGPKFVIPLHPNDT